MIQEASPPRNDVAQLVTWETHDRAGQQVYVEMIDGDTGTAYAWMCAGRFSVRGLNPNGMNEDRKQAAELIGLFGLVDFRNQLGSLLQASGQSELSLAFARTLADMSNPKLRGVMRATAESLVVEGLSLEQRSQTTQALVLGDPWVGSVSIHEAMKSATAAEQLAMMKALSADQSGLPILLTLVRDGQVAADMLAQPSIAQAVSLIGTEEQKAQLARLTANLPDRDKALDALINARKASCREQGGDTVAGRTLFQQLCMVCHQFGGEGQNLAPNLDGIGNRGLDRLVEDILDPNRNVDTAFRITSLVLNDGSAISGFIRSEETEHVILADAVGGKRTIAIDQIKERVPSALSLMPASFGQSLTETQFRDLMAWLVAQR